VPRWALLVFVGVACVCFFKLGSTTITETDEGFAGTRADSFLRHGSWALSYDDVNDDQPQFRKPPLLYWLVAVLLTVVGHGTWAVRLPTAAAGFLSAWLLFRLARRPLGDRAALCAALLTCAVPLFVLHIRTAMLEVPVIACLLAGIAAAHLLPETWWRPVVVGLCGGAALMIKGPGGIMAAAVPVLLGLAHQRLRPRAWVEGLVAVAVALALPALWYLAIPHAHRGRVFSELIVGETAKRVRAGEGAWLRLRTGGGVLADMLRWHLPAAACGMALALARGWRNRDLREWLGASLVVTVPLLWAYAAMVPPYPRYLLPAVPFLLSFSAYFALEAVTGRAAGLLLLPFAAASATMGAADPWRWAPAAAAAAAFVAVWTGWAPDRPHRRLAVGGALLAAIAGASWISPTALSLPLPPHQQPRPELVPLLRQASALIPENERLIVEKGPTVHTMLFYGRRAIQTHDLWLFNAIAGRAVRYGVFREDVLGGIPGIRQEEVGRSGSWRLTRLTVDQGDRPLVGVLFAEQHRRSATANALESLGVGFEPFRRGFLVRNIPDDDGSEVPALSQRRRLLLASGAARPGDPGPGPVTIGAGEAVELTFPSPRRIVGVDILPAGRQGELGGWVVEAAEGDGPWSELRRIDGPLEPLITVAGSRMGKERLPAARARFSAITADRLKVVRTAAEPIAVEQVRVLESRAGSGERPGNGREIP